MPPRSIDLDLALILTIYTFLLLMQVRRREETLRGPLQQQGLQALHAPGMSIPPSGIPLPSAPSPPKGVSLQSPQQQQQQRDLGSRSSAEREQDPGTATSVEFAVSSAAAALSPAVLAAADYFRARTQQVWLWGWLWPHVYLRAPPSNCLSSVFFTVCKPERQLSPACCLQAAGGLSAVRNPNSEGIVGRAAPEPAPTAASPDRDYWAGFPDSPPQLPPSPLAAAAGEGRGGNGGGGDAGAPLDPESDVFEQELDRQLGAMMRQLGIQQQV